MFAAVATEDVAIVTGFPLCLDLVSNTSDSKCGWKNRRLDLLVIRLIVLSLCLRRVNFEVYNYYTQCGALYDLRGKRSLSSHNTTLSMKQFL